METERQEDRGPPPETGDPVPAPGPSSFPIPDSPSPLSEPSPLGVDDFLKTVLRSGLLDRDALQDALRGVPLAQRDDSRAARGTASGPSSTTRRKRLLPGMYSMAM